MENVSLRSAEGLIALMGIKGLGPATAVKLAGRFRSLSEILGSAPDDLKGLATEPIRRVLVEGGNQVTDAFGRALGEVARAEDMGARVLSAFDDGYPQRLAGIPDRPLVIYTSGDLSLLDRSVACVGTREPTQFGAAVAQRLTTMLGEAGWTIVSGLARGVDAICHEAALACGAPTAAVLGSGIDTYSSEAALRLAERIAEAGGLVISEQPLGREADPSSLIRRNRIQSGVSAATFFMQAGMESGTMHTVRYALLQGRPIFAPGIPAAFAGEELNQAAMCLTRMAAPQFGMAIDAKESVMEAIGKLDRENVAFEISGKDSYPDILRKLDGLIEKTHQPALSP